MSKTPPDNTRAYSPRLIWVFEKFQGTVGSTFYGRLISRAAIMVTPTDGGTVQSARYNGRFWRLYPAEAFPEMRQKWVKPGEAIYLDGARLKLPLKHPFMFDCDKPLGLY